MDAQSGVGVGEVRRIHIMYYLSRKGRIEHPHLIRVHHLSRNGVHLRDVKRWLSELRGKDMAESFAWSYKRRYKTGCVWQDLLDEDLITPFSDNEYVLKGSEISSTTISSSANDADLTYQGEANSHGYTSKKKNQDHPQDSLMQDSAQKSTEIEQESPPCSSETSTVTDESTKNEEQEEKNYKPVKDNIQKKKNSLYSTLLNKNKNKKIDIDNNNSNANKSRVKKSSRSYSFGTSNMLRNIITCGAIDTNESAVVKVDRRDKISLSAYTSKIIANIMPEICKGEERGGSERISGNVYSNVQQQYQSGRKSWDGVKISRKNNSKTEFMGKQKTAASFKPVNGPNCSQCGKSFKPEKLHQHMKSCQGIKAFLTKSPVSTSNILVKY